MAAYFTDYLHSLARRLHLEPGEEQDIILELEGHLEDKAAELESQGLDRDSALKLAVQEMGAPEPVASGMYLYQMEAGGFAASKTMLLAK